jgi:hypothetical protein
MRLSALRVGVFAALSVAGLVGTAGAAPILSGNATIAFSGDFGDGPNSVNASDVVTVGTGPEIAFGDGSIGSLVLLDLEALDLSGLTITYTIQGGGFEDPLDTGNPGFLNNGMLAGTFTFSGLGFAPGATIIGITTTLVDVIDPTNALAGFGFTGNSLTMSGLERFLLHEGEVNTGTVTVTLQVREDVAPPPPPVPEPATLALLGGGLAVLARRRRHART